MLQTFGSLSQGLRVTLLINSRDESRSVQHQNKAPLDYEIIKSKDDIILSLLENLPGSKVSFCRSKFEALRWEVSGPNLKHC